MKEALCCGIRIVAPSVGDLEQQFASLTGCRVRSGARSDDLTRAAVEVFTTPVPNEELVARWLAVDIGAEAVANVLKTLTGQA